jgi:hypothetical protein
MNINQEIAEKILCVPYDGEDYTLDFLAMDILEHRQISFGIVSDETGYTVTLGGHNMNYKKQGKRLGQVICECLMARYKGERSRHDSRRKQTNR